MLRIRIHTRRGSGSGIRPTCSFNTKILQYDILKNILKRYVFFQPVKFWIRLELYGKSKNLIIIFYKELDTRHKYRNSLLNGLKTLARRTQPLNIVSILLYSKYSTKNMPKCKYWLSGRTLLRALYCLNQ